MKRALFFSPHTDDVELGAGGTLAKFTKSYQVYVIAFSDARHALLPHLPEDTLRKEMLAAMNVLHIDEGNVQFFDFETRRFQSSRQEILDVIIKLRDTIKPDIVFAPSTCDNHQDHQVIISEVLRAFKGSDSTILGYEQPWNNFSFETTCFVNLNETDINRKVKALEQYKSQSHRLYINENFIRSLASIRGVQIGKKYAEAFEALRVVFN